MTTLSKIETSSNWGSEATKINQNFTNVSLELTKLGMLGKASFGPYKSSLNLPSGASENATAWVSATLTPPFQVWQVQSGKWVNTGFTYTQDIGTGDLATKDDLSEQDAKLAELSSQIEELEESVESKQEKLVSGTTIKTINNESILGNGNIELDLLGIGTFTDALKLAAKKTKPFTFILNEDDLRKPIWHVGNGVFIDAVGAEISLPYNEWEIYNFTYKVKLQEQNETVYVPTAGKGKLYNMRVDWGDGTVDTYQGKGIYKSCSHQYTGNVGDVFEIILSGTIPYLYFGMLSAGGNNTLHEIVNNTLKNPFELYSFSDCSCLIRVSSNTFNNVKNLTSIDFSRAALEEIEDGHFVNLDKSSLSSVVFLDTNIKVLSDDFFEGMNLTSISNLFRGTKIDRIPLSLKSAIKNITTASAAFYNLKSETPLIVPSDLFDEVVSPITSLSTCFAGVSPLGKSQVTGDAKALYDVLLSKITGEATYINCFANNEMYNLEQVPKAWGGKL